MRFSVPSHALLSAVSWRYRYPGSYKTETGWPPVMRSHVPAHVLGKELGMRITARWGSALVVLVATTTATLAQPPDRPGGSPAGSDRDRRGPPPGFTGGRPGRGGPREAPDGRRWDYQREGRGPANARRGPWGPPAGADKLRPGAHGRFRGFDGTPRRFGAWRGPWGPPRAWWGPPPRFARGRRGPGGPFREFGARRPRYGPWRGGWGPPALARDGRGFDRRPRGFGGPPRRSDRWRGPWLGPRGPWGPPPRAGRDRWWSSME